MNRLFILVAIASVGCGFPLSPDAKPCGTRLGMDVYVGKEGMTCEQAFKTVDAAVAVGNSRGFWKDTSGSFLAGMRLEFIAGENLKVLGFEEKNGFTVNSPFAHDMAVVSGLDGSNNYELGPDQAALNASHYPPADDGSWVNVWPSAVILAHEMIHVLQTNSFLNAGAVLNTHTDQHCHWSRSYAPKFEGLGWAQYQSNFIDGCDHKQCSGTRCWEVKP
jgi:hypothetical protein